MTHPDMLYSDPSSRRAGKRPLGSITGVFDLGGGFSSSADLVRPCDGRRLKAHSVFGQLE